MNVVRLNRKTDRHLQHVGKRGAGLLRFVVQNCQPSTDNSTTET
jgi:hypothetical protein